MPCTPCRWRGPGADTPSMSEARARPIVNMLHTVCSPCVPRKWCSLQSGAGRRRPCQAAQQTAGGCAASCRSLPGCLQAAGLLPHLQLQGGALASPASGLQRLQQAQTSSWVTEVSAVCCALQRLASLFAGRLHHNACSWHTSEQDGCSLSLCFLMSRAWLAGLATAQAAALVLKAGP